MTKNRFSKSVAFNRTNENDQKILKHVSRRNFSKYVKKLILDDMKEKQKEAPQEVEQPPKPQTSKDRLDQLKKKQKRPDNTGPRLFNQ